MAEPPQDRVMGQDCRALLAIFAALKHCTEPKVRACEKWKPVFG